MASINDADIRMDALVAEVEVRKKNDHTYSYGRLIADTTEIERDKIAEQYRRTGSRKRKSAGKFPDVSIREELRGIQTECLEQLEGETSTQ